MVRKKEKVKSTEKLFKWVFLSYDEVYKIITKSKFVNFCAKYLRVTICFKVVTN